MDNMHTVGPRACLAPEHAGQCAVQERAEDREIARDQVELLPEGEWGIRALWHGDLKAAVVMALGGCQGIVKTGKLNEAIHEERDDGASTLGKLTPQRSLSMMSNIGGGSALAEVICW